MRRQAQGGSRPQEPEPKPEPESLCKGKEVQKKMRVNKSMNGGRAEELGCVTVGAFMRSTLREEE